MSRRRSRVPALEMRRKAVGCFVGPQPSDVTPDRRVLGHSDVLRAELSRTFPANVDGFVEQRTAVGARFAGLIEDGGPLALAVEGSYERYFLPRRTDFERFPIAGRSLCFQQRTD